MKTTKKFVIALMLGSAVVFTAGCSVANKQETLGQYVDGTAVTAEIKTRLLNDPRTSALSVKVKTIDGGVVQLSGFVKSPVEKEQAGEIARSVKGVTRVINDIVVSPY